MIHTLMGRDTVAVLYHFQVGKDEGKSFSSFFFGAE